MTRRRHRALAAAALTASLPLLGVACAAPAGARRAASTAAARGAQSSAPRAPVAWEAVVLPPTEQRDEPLVAAQEPDGALCVIAGGMRARVHAGAGAAADAVEWARDATLHAIRAWARDGEQRWLFATADGALFRAEASFTGPLTRVGDADGQGLLRGFEGVGVLAVERHDHALWLGSADAGFRAAPAPADAPLVSAAFADRLFGLAVVAPGRLLRTTDGGERYERVRTSPHAAFRVTPHADGFVVETTGGALRVGPSGAPTPHTGAAAGVDRTVPSEARRALVASLLAESPFAQPLFLAAGAVALADGRFAQVDGEERLMVRGGGGGAVTPAARPAPVEMPAAHCDVFAYGARVLARCPAPDDGGALLAVGDGTRAFTELRRFAGDSEMVAAPDGGAIVVAGPCEAPGGAAASSADGRARDDTPVCWYDGAAWRTRELPGRVRLLAAHGDAVLFVSLDEAGEEPDDADEWMRVVRASDADAGGRAVTLEGAAQQGAALLRAGFTPDGLLAGVARRGAQYFTALGPLDRPLALRPLPRGARAVAFADAQRGIAVGADLGQVWTTTDAARSWTRLALPVDGDPASVALARPHGDAFGAGAAGPEEAVTPVCSASACVVGARLVWAAPAVVGTAGPGVAPRVPAAPRRPLAPPRAAAADGGSGADSPDEDGFRAGSWRCEPRDGAASSLRRSLTLTMQGGAANSALPTVPPARTYGGDGWLEPGLTAARDALGGRFAFAWGGTDERGRFRASARPAVLPPVALPAGATPDGAAAVPRVLTRRLALVERCVSAQYTSYCDLVAAPAGGAPRVLGALHALLDIDARRVATRGALALPDGGALVHLNPVRDDEDEVHADLLLRLDARGTITARRGFAWSAAPSARLLARGPDGPGLAVAPAGAPRALVFYGLDPEGAGDGRALVTLPRRPLPACDGAAPPPGATHVLTTARGYGPLVFVGPHQLETPASGHATLEVDPRGGGAVCLRGVSFWSGEPGSVSERELVGYAGGAPRLRAVNGALAGVAVDSSRDVALTCRWMRP